MPILGYGLTKNYYEIDQEKHNVTIMNVFDNAVYIFYKNTSCYSICDRYPELLFKYYTLVTATDKLFYFLL